VGNGMLMLAIDECYKLMHNAPLPASTFKSFGKP